MSKVNLIYETGLEVFSESNDGTVWMTQSGLARLCGVPLSTLSRWKEVGEVANVPTITGIKESRLYHEGQIAIALERYKPEVFYTNAQRLSIDYCPQSYSLSFLHLLTRKLVLNGEDEKLRATVLDIIALNCFNECVDTSVVCNASDRWMAEYNVDGSIYSRQNYKSIDFMESFNSVKKDVEINRRRLTRASESLGYEIVELKYHTNRTKRLYHHDIWKLCYPNLRLPTAYKPLVGSDTRELAIA